MLLKFAENLLLLLVSLLIVVLSIGNTALQLDFFRLLKRDILNARRLGFWFCLCFHIKKRGEKLYSVTPIR
jgi:hypothetical protein